MELWRRMLYIPLSVTPDRRISAQSLKLSGSPLGTLEISEGVGGTKHALFTDGNLMGFAHKSLAHTRVLFASFNTCLKKQCLLRTYAAFVSDSNTLSHISYRNICGILRINCKSLAHRRPHSRLQLGFYNILASFCLDWEKKKWLMTSTYS